MSLISEIETTIAASQQSVSCVRIIARSDNGLKFRFTVKSDSYDFQSAAYADVWDARELRWNRAYYIPYAEMKTAHGLVHHRQKPGLAAFQADLERLQRQTFLIVC